MRLLGATPQAAVVPVDGETIVENRFQMYVIRFRPVLLAQANTLCRNSTDAEDLVQEVFARFIRTFRDTVPLPTESSCISWLLKTLKNLFLDSLRRQQTRDAHVTAAAATQEEPATSDESDHPYANLTDDQIAVAVRSLSPKLQETWELYAAEFPHAIIAQRLGIPMGTVGKRLHDAKRKLREKLEQYAEASKR